jgi:hypothetical protein
MRVGRVHVASKRSLVGLRGLAGALAAVQKPENVIRVSKIEQRPARQGCKVHRCPLTGNNRLMLLAQSGAEATILTSLMRSWKMIANQTDRYVAIMKTEAAQRRHGQVRIHLGKTHGRGERDDRQV